jgi:hypothetical protein
LTLKELFDEWRNKSEKSEGYYNITIRSSIFSERRTQCLKGSLLVQKQNAKYPNEIPLWR